MSTADHLSPPETADRHRFYLAVAMLAAAVLSAANAAQRVVPSELTRFAEWVQVSMVAAIVVALVPMALWKVRHRDADLRYLYCSEDGFVAQSLNRAKNASWVTTFVLLSALPAAARRFDSVPADVFTYLTTTVMLGVFAGVFLFLNRSVDDASTDAFDA